MGNNNNNSRCRVELSPPVDYLGPAERCAGLALLDLVGREAGDSDGKFLQDLVGRKASDFTQGLSARSQTFWRGRELAPATERA